MLGGVPLASVLGPMLWNRSVSPQPIPVSLTCSASETPGIPSDLPWWPFIGCDFCLGVAVGFAVGFLACAALCCASCWISLHVAPSEKGDLAMAVGRVSARSMAFDSADKFSWVEGLWFDRTGVPELVRIGSLSCVGAPLRPIVDGGMFVCPGSVAVRSTFLMEARLSEGFNPEIDGEDEIQVCVIELSGEAFDSITTLPLEVGDLGFSDDG